MLISRMMFQGYCLNSRARGDGDLEYVFLKEHPIAIVA